MSNASKRRRVQPRTGKRAIIYTRQSIAREESISLENQEEICRAYANRMGYQVVKTISDPGISGLEFEKRPGIQEAVALVQRDEADIIIGWEYSRISRDDFDQVDIDRRVESVGGRVESATEGNEWEAKKINQFVSALDSKQKSRRWKEVQARRIRNGLPAGGGPPLGYRKNGTGGPFVPDEVYADVIREAYDLYLAGRGPAGIAKVFNQRGLTTPRGKVFTTSTIVRALDGGFAAGYIVRYGEHVKGAHEPLIEEATWQAYVDERDRRRRESPNPKSRQPRWFLGAGLAVCGGCGASLHVLSYKERYQKVVCAHYRNRPGTCPTGTWVDKTKLELLVGIWLGAHVDEWTRAAEAASGSMDDERATLAKAIDAERAEEAKVRDGLRRAARLVASGDMSDEDYRAAKIDADAQLRELVSRITDLRARLDALDPAGDAYDRLVRALGRVNQDEVGLQQPVDIAVPFDVPGDVAWPVEHVPAMPPEEWHALLRRVIKEVRVNRDTVVITPHVGQATTYDRATVMPQRRRTDVQVRDPRTGRFVPKTSAAA